MSFSAFSPLLCLYSFEDHFSSYYGTDYELNLTHLSTVGSANEDLGGSDPVFILSQASVFILTIPRELLPCILLSKF